MMDVWQNCLEHWTIMAVTGLGFWDLPGKRTHHKEYDYLTASSSRAFKIQLTPGPGLTLLKLLPVRGRAIPAQQGNPSQGSVPSGASWWSGQDSSGAYSI